MTTYINMATTAHGPSNYQINENNADLIIKNLWLGNYKAAFDLNFLLKQNIHYIVNVSDDVPCIFGHINYMQIPIKDKNICHDQSMPKVIDQALKFIHYGLSQNQGVLVHCVHGRHRSAGIAMAYLIKYCSMCYSDSKSYIISRRPKALNRKTCIDYWVYEISRSFGSR